MIYIWYVYWARINTCHPADRLCAESCKLLDSKNSNNLREIESDFPPQDFYQLMSLKIPFWQVVTYMPTNVREPTYDVVKSAILWVFAPSSNNCNLTILCLSNYFDTILTIFTKSMNYFVVDKYAITIQHSINKEVWSVSLFHPLWKNMAYLSFFGVRNLITVEGLFIFSVPKFDLLLFFPIERSISATCNMSQANRVVFNGFFYN